MWPYVYFNGRLTLLEPSATPADIFFGGPFQLSIDGGRDYPRLHRTLTLTGGSVEMLPGKQLIGSVPLIYAFQYRQNEIRYRLTGSEVPEQGIWVDDQSIKNLKLDAGTYDPAWPYRDYPTIFPYLHLKVARVLDIGKEEFCAKYVGEELTLQPEELVAGVPTNRTLGYSMWGLQGDLEDILLLFVFNTRTLQVKAWHRLP